MKRRIFLTSALSLTRAPLLLSPFANACRRSRSWKVGVVPNGASSAFWQPVYAGAMAAGRDFETEILWESPAEDTDVERQIEIVRSFIERSVDGIVLAPSDRARLVPVVEQAAAVGIPLTIFYSGIETENYVSYVGTDNRAAGQMAATALSGLLEARDKIGPDKIGMVKHIPGSEPTEERERGFSEALEQRFAKDRIAAARYCMASRAEALDIAQDMLRRHPDIAALFGSSEAATIGAMRALRLHTAKSRVRLVGIDAAFSLLEGLRDGVVDALVVRDPFYIGYAGLKTVVQKLNGVQPPRRIHSPARLVTAENLDRPEIQKLLNPPIAPRRRKE